MSGGVMQQRNNDFGDPRYYGAVRTKLGESLRQQYDLKEPLPLGLVELLDRLRASAHAREVAEAKVYAELEEAIATMVCAAGRPRQPEEP